MNRQVQRALTRLRSRHSSEAVGRLQALVDGNPINQICALTDDLLTVRMHGNLAVWSMKKGLMSLFRFHTVEIQEGFVVMTGTEINTIRESLRIS